MKQLSFGLLVVCVLAAPCLAQYVIDPAALGTAYREEMYASWMQNGQYGSDHSIEYRAKAGLAAGCSFTVFHGTGAERDYYWRQTDRQLTAVMEFNLDSTSGGAELPLPWMTADNWTAHLTGLQVTAAMGEGETMEFFLQDLDPDQQDGEITGDDYGASASLARILDHVASAGTELPPMDVTDALRSDLFGGGAAFSGFAVTSQILPSVNRYIQLSGDSPRIVITGHPATPTPESSPAPEPSQTPDPGAPRCEISMPSHTYQPGDPCHCIVSISNPGDTDLTGVPLFVILELPGVMLFAPGFDQSMEFYSLNIPPGGLSLTVIPGFTWPENAGVLDRAVWHAALTDPGVTALFGEPGEFVFSWSE